MVRVLKTIMYGGGGVGIMTTGVYYFLKINFRKGMIDKDVTYKYRPVDSRNEMIKKLKSINYDVLIIGGGATGGGIALDCATRGIRCALIERDDFSSGTSSKSTKLLHGGIRYLESAVKNLDLSELYFVWEALAERAHTMNIAPYMSRPVSILMPVYKLWQVPYFAYNIKVYDFLADLVCCFQKGVPNSFYINKTNTLENFPLLIKNKLKGSLIYYDGQHDDSRMNLNLVLTSAIDNYIPGQVGATICNHMEAIGFIKDENTHKIIGVKAYDKINKEEIEIYSKIVINASGPYGDLVRKLADENITPVLKLSVGCHFILPRWYSSRNNGMILPETSDKRVLFLLPWENCTLVGTTDEERTLEEKPKVNKKDIEFLSNELSSYINVSNTEIKQDIKAAWCGYRPLVLNVNSKKKGNKKETKEISTQDISRSHEIIEDECGLINILGGKWTIYRKMAQDTVDYILSKYKDKIKTTHTCRTKFLKLIGCHDENGTYSLEDLVFGSSKLSKQLMKKYPQLEYETANHLVGSYGYLAKEVCHLAEQKNLFQKLDPSKPYIEAEVLYATKNEFAHKVSDIIGRRLRLGFVDSAIASRVVQRIANIMKDELHWSNEQLQKNVEEAHEYIESLSLY